MNVFSKVKAKVASVLQSQEVLIEQLAADVE
jgi:hypothetical protein